LFIKLEHVSKAQAVIFPDSFYHKDESVAGDHVDFNLMRRLYEHLSSGKTLYPGFVIEKIQSFRLSNLGSRVRTLFLNIKLNLFHSREIVSMIGLLD